MAEINGLFSLIENRKYDSSICFLCGCELNSENDSDEHVFPKWLQNEFDLWNQELVLINQTSIKYKQLKIPCCKKCNNEYLSPIEIMICSAYNKGFEEFKKIDKMTLYLWLGKIYYGVMYKELFLIKNRKLNDGEKILTPEYMSSFKTLFIFLQQIRKAHVCKDFFPGSIYIVHLQKCTNKLQNFDYIDNHNKMFIALRLGEIGIISPLEDMESIKDCFDFSIFSQVELHPIQFKEMCAVVYYAYLLFNRTPKFFSGQIQSNDYAETSLLPLGGFSGKSIFDPWDDNSFKPVLSYFTGASYDEMLKYPDQIISWIHDENGKVKYIEYK